MGQNENIMAQQLQDIKINLESRDIAKVYQLCDKVQVTIKKYHIDESITPKIKIITDIAQPSTPYLTLNDRVREIDTLIDILNATKG